MDQNFAQLAVPRLWALEDEVLIAWRAALGRARVLQSIDIDRQLRQEWRFLVSRMAAGRLGNDEEIRARGGWHTGGLGCDVAAVRLGFAAIGMIEADLQLPAEPLVEEFACFRDG